MEERDGAVPLDLQGEDEAVTEDPLRRVGGEGAATGAGELAQES
jgi:hypothetical protein